MERGAVVTHLRHHAFNDRPLVDLGTYRPIPRAVVLNVQNGTDSAFLGKYDDYEMVRVIDGLSISI